MSDQDNDKSESEKPVEPKLVVDDDWKEQVAREKQLQAEKPAAAEAQPTDATADEADQDPQADAKIAEELPPPPPASFDVLISMMFTQAMAMLGQLPDPSTGKSQVNKPYAKHYIDTLEMLGVKTKGNLSEDEAQMLQEALHALRMTYVNVKA